MQKLLVFILSGIAGSVLTGSASITAAASLLASANVVELARDDVLNAVTAMVPSMIVVGALTGFAARSQQLNGLVVALGASLGWLAGTFLVFALAQRTAIPGNYSTVMLVLTGWICGVLSLLVAGKALRAA